ncbi:MULTISPECIES: hypothetical protein [unclassified Leuconostoc]|uniref:hypothetical protein n=1 Tax=unclassified Leuconostoc TaxID=2685106 RepID=UPI0019073E39|nr:MULTISPECIES: hypothetical protein [unclassified Leuconostoc]MBK0040762.1 hypothetical protein [Leuconostoc sp. S51]MBK0051816.1 hypothetical protein [Leuconostoc sp. S50]
MNKKHLQLIKKYIISFVGYCSVIAATIYFMIALTIISMDTSLKVEQIEHITTGQIHQSIRISIMAWHILFWLPIAIAWLLIAGKICLDFLMYKKSKKV